MKDRPFWNPVKPKRFYDVLNRFWSKVNKDDIKGCWKWTASLDGSGYGQLILLLPTGKQRVMRAHRLAWDIIQGPLDDSHFIRNTCGNRACVKPDHWQLEPDHWHTVPTRQKMAALATERSVVSHAIHSPTIRDLEWIAGFMEGEGNFRYGRTPAARASQVNQEPVLRLQRLLGGTIRYSERQSERHHPFYTWETSGARARGIMLTLYPLMSAKRKEQIHSAMRSRP